MDFKVKKSCPSCSQPFSLKSTNQHQKCRLPLLLSCGHSICEVCVRNILKFTEPIECKVCKREMEISSSSLMLSQTNLYSVFPTNMHMVGQLTMQMMVDSDKRGSPEKECYIDLKELLIKLDNKKGQCVECQGHTTKMCQQCVTVLCDTCFHKTHKFHIFKSHVLKEIDLGMEPNYCKIHKEKPLDYYCKDCSKAICMDCMMIGGDKSCKNHDIVSAQEMNESLYEEINDITPKVDETFRRLTKTAVDIGHLLKKAEAGKADTPLNKIIMDVEHHFCKLFAAMQKHEQEVMDIMMKLRDNEENSLLKAKNDVTERIKTAKGILNKLNNAMLPENLNKMNLSVLMDDAKQIVNYPWFLDKDDISENTLKVAVNEDLCALISDYIHLDGNANSAYKLLGINEIGEGVELPAAPSKPVFPPEIIKDVRELYKPRASPESAKPRPPPRDPAAVLTQIPQYRSKSGSTNSINSIGSDSSYAKRPPSCAESYPVVHQVPPFAESNHFQPLVEGAQELIYVSHIIDPHNLFVQRACHQDLVKEMLKEFKTAIALPKPNASRVVEGKIYLAFNRADKEWQRCRVVSVDRRNSAKPLYRVFCIDFGSTELVSIDKLRLVPAARQQFPPPLALHCSIANCEPKNGAWNSDDSVLIQKIIDNKQAVIHVRRAVSASNYNVTMQCDVTTFEDGVSLAHALVFHERATMPHPRLRYAAAAGMSERPRLFPGGGDYRPKQVEEVLVTNVVNPDRFYVRKCHLQTTFEKLTEELEDEYGFNNHNRVVYCPEEEMVCVVNVMSAANATSATSGGWRRGLVLSVPGRQRARVALVDTGEVALVHYSCMRHIRPAFTKMNALATECHLSGVTPYNGKWSVRAVALMDNYRHRALELHVEASRAGRRSVGVTLYDKADPEQEVCLNAEMVRHKFAVTIGVFMFNRNISEDQAYTNKTPLDKPQTTKDHKPKKDTIKILKRGDSNSPKIEINEEDLEAKDKGPIKLEVKVLSCPSPSLVYVALVDQQKTFKELYEKIQEHYTKEKVPGKKEWQVDDKCCNLCEESKTWRRATIVEIDGETAKIFYTDFACVEKAPLANLKELAPEFAAVGGAAIKCHLSGIMPAVGEEWPSLTKEHLNELVDAYQRIFITKNGDIKNRSWPVELWAYHVIQGGALEPDKGEWRCLNKNIVDQGLGVPDKSQQDAAAKDKQSAGADTISFLSVTGSLSDWLQLEPLATESIPAAMPESDDVDRSVAGNTLLVSEWLPAEPLSANEFAGVPTYIDYSGVIFLHDVCQQDTLDLIRKALDVRFKQPEPRARHYKWAPGQPCIARFYLDERFYRGRVLEVDEENETCIVHYVDYGNEEVCAFKDMRRTIVLYNIPVQAKRCVLARVRPPAPGGGWPKLTLDYVHKSIVEKQCYIKVTGAGAGGVAVADIKVGDVYINELLVELGMADYTDGTRPLVPKYAPRREPAAAGPAVPSDRSVPSAASDSGPDYLVDDATEPPDSDDDDEPADSDDDDSTDTDTETEEEASAGRNWAELVEQEDAAGELVALPARALHVPYRCTLAHITGTEVDLLAEHEAAAAAEYAALHAAMQRGARAQPPLDARRVRPGQAVLARYADGSWYRARVLRLLAGRRARLLLYYTEHAHADEVPVRRVRALPSCWARLPPAAVRARLRGVRLRAGADLQRARELYSQHYFPAGGPRRLLATLHDGRAGLTAELCDEEAGARVDAPLLDAGIYERTAHSDDDDDDGSGDVD